MVPPDISALEFSAGNGSVLQKLDGFLIATFVNLFGAGTRGTSHSRAQAEGSSHILASVSAATISHSHSFLLRILSHLITEFIGITFPASLRRAENISLPLMHFRWLLTNWALTLSGPPSLIHEIALNLLASRHGSEAKCSQPSDIIE
jgi:hypothetical protein